MKMVKSTSFWDTESFVKSSQSSSTVLHLFSYYRNRHHDNEYCLKLQKQHNCIPDEHYVQTLLAMSELEGELERRTLTYSLWNNSAATKTESKGWHPMTFNHANAAPKKIKEIKDVNHVYYETEYRTEWCRVNSTYVPCFLFARKFSPGAAMRLLSGGVVGQFDTSALLNPPP
ncbi:hypothetical protein C1H46_039688 [Malus baccata]|uniref:Uncharacterized protein n=1 Tax=Malus baccata TaxID=106549 RepID=A0A540KKQ6_MALBA|nr:hypothetical protein C1H46_039688 [Malus baccata]